MPKFTPTFSVERLDGEREIHWRGAGLWEMKDLIALQSELLEKSKPFRDDRMGFRVLGDLREILVQKPGLVEHMQATQEATAKIGVDKIAVLYSSTLLKQQFRRVSSALDCQFFTDTNEALEWLRR